MAFSLTHLLFASQAFSVLEWNDEEHPERVGQTSLTESVRKFRGGKSEHAVSKGKA